MNGQVNKMLLSIKKGQFNPQSVRIFPPTCRHINLSRFFLVLVEEILSKLINNPDELKALSLLSGESLIPFKIRGQPKS